MNCNENNNNAPQSMYDQCRRCVTYHVILTMRDGSIFDGIIEGVDRENVNLLVGEPTMIEEGNQGQNQGQNQNQSYGRQEYGYDGYGRPRRGRRVRRFRRRSFPLALLAALDLVPYPYVVPLYPFFPY